ncbi:unannotated protein [freshwater metagenome]|uniref:Unannotated protein n=1 Tax=freshwater metagenome TaxID=449393 RepID=A0A6J7G605_9ZZZZ|nr:DUF4287 domain-containing protein [Actinomycetota bacterium]MSY37958.1 DUF4287 domain-containing protein [Actinomycetota bacterium]MSZ41048.1 DUF4287 domain-containing protein [Actinomycetota bacterium]
MAVKSPERDTYFPAIEKKYGQPMTYWFDQMSERADWKYAEQMAFLKEEHGFSQAHANALVMYCRGSKTTRRFNSLEDYLAPFDDTKQTTVRNIFKAITSQYPKLELVIAWNQPMLKSGDQYVFGLSVHTKHILLAPTNPEILEQFKTRLASYEVLKKTFKVPVNWKVDKKLLQDMVAAQIAEIQ